MKKFIVGLMIAATLSTVIPSDCSAVFLTEKNTNLCDGHITKIKTDSHGGRRVYVKFSGMYSGRKKSIKLSRYEWKAWQKEQGKIKTGAAVECILYTKNTATLKDDVIVNIHI